MTLEQLRIFVAVAEREHVTQAARALNMTQSATSAAVTALEGRYATRNGLMPSPAKVRPHASSWEQFICFRKAFMPLRSMPLARVPTWFLMNRSM